MPEMLPIPGGANAYAYADEIQNAAVATLNADPRVGTGGTLGVLAREVRYEQFDDEERQLLQVEIPSIMVQCTSGSSERVAALRKRVDHTMLVVVVTEHGNIRTAHTDNLKIRDAAMMALDGVNGSATWLASGAQVWTGRISLGDPEHQPQSENPNLFVSASTIEYGVLWHEEVIAQ